MTPMTASARSPATSHTSPRRIQDPNPLFCRVPCECRSVCRGGTLLCMLLSPYGSVLAPFSEHLLDGYGRKFTSPARVAELRHPEPRIEDEAPPQASTLRPRRWRFSESLQSLCRG